MATEGISVSYGEVICGGDKSVDRKIGRMLDKGRVLAAVDKLPEHLSSWLLVAYAAPGYVSESRAQYFYEIVMAEFTGRYVGGGIHLSESKWEMFRKIIPLICYDVARNGVSLSQFRPSEYMAALVGNSNCNIASVRSNWKRDWAESVEAMRNILNQWDLLAKQTIKRLI